MNYSLMTKLAAVLFIVFFVSPFFGATAERSNREIGGSVERTTPGQALASESIGEASQLEFLLVRNQVLKQELLLASKPQLYFLLNLTEKRLQLKARGMVLKEWALTRVRRWGPHPRLEPLTLGKKSALFAPKRKAIKPGENQSKDTFELEALELKDMPTIFTLNLEEGIKIYVRPKPQGFLARLAHIGLHFRWYGWFPLRNMYRRIARKPFISLEITVSSPVEAKAIYWAMLDGLKGLIYSVPKS
jgi:hypothetical protein